MRSTISRVSIWCGAAVVVLAAAGCSSDPVSPGVGLAGGHALTLRSARRRPPAGSTTINLASGSSTQYCGYATALDGSCQSERLLRELV